MSIRIMSTVFAANGLSSTSKLVLLSLADHANDQGRSIYPSVDTTAQRTGLTDRSIQRVIEDLVESNILIVVRKGGGRYNTNEYRINIDELTTYLPKGDTQSPIEEKGDSVSQKGDTVSLKGDTQSQKGDTVSPDPLLTINESSLTIERSVTVPESHLIDSQEAVRIFRDVTGLATLPPARMDKDLEIICSMVNHYGLASAIARMKAAFAGWRTGKRKDTGRAYSIANTAWLDYALAGEVPGSAVPIIQAKPTSKDGSINV